MPSFGVEILAGNSVNQAQSSVGGRAEIEVGTSHGIKVSGIGIDMIQKISSAQYAALPVKNPTTFYVVTA